MFMQGRESSETEILDRKTGKSRVSRRVESLVSNTMENVSKTNTKKCTLHLATRKS